MNYARGFVSAFVLGTIGFLLPILIGSAFTVCRWWIGGSDEFDRSYDLRWLPTYLADPAVGTAILFAAAGWATFAPHIQRRFAATLVAVTVFTIPTWCVLAVASEGWRHRIKGDHGPLVDPYGVFLFTVPAVLLAILLSVVPDRVRLPGDIKKRAFDEL